MFLLHGLTLSGVGVVVGLVVAAALGRSMSSLLFGIEPMDPAAYMAAIGVILAAAALASHLPARRAATTIRARGRDARHAPNSSRSTRLAAAASADTTTETAYCELVADLAPNKRFLQPNGRSAQRSITNR